MSDYLEYDGQILRWMPRAVSYKASSGLRDGLSDYQKPADQCVADAGPIPAGSYYLLLQIDPHKYAAHDGTAACNLKPGSAIQYIPRGGSMSHAPTKSEAGMCEDPYWANWGWRRVRLEAADRATSTACLPRRAGFYIHDSSKGYTHGCIEVEQSFFIDLIAFVKKSKQKRMSLRVAYKHASTYGGTKSP